MEQRKPGVQAPAGTVRITGRGIGAPRSSPATTANLPVIARIVWYAVGRRQYARRTALIRGAIAA